MIAFPDCARGPRSFGPPRDRSSRLQGVIPDSGDNVLFSGFRLEGPTSSIRQSDDILEKWILIWPIASLAPVSRVDISNMEILQWSGVDVRVTDSERQAERGRLFNTKESGVHIWNNFFTHNRHGSGNGCGVESSGGAYALLERNVFDENRPAIAGGATWMRSIIPATPRGTISFFRAVDYIARMPAISRFARCCAIAGIHTSSHNWECSIAGETMIIQRNTVLYTARLAIRIRGSPTDRAIVEGVDSVAQAGAMRLVKTATAALDTTSPIDVRPTTGSCDMLAMVRRIVSWRQA